MGVNCINTSLKEFNVCKKAEDYSEEIVKFQVEVANSLPRKDKKIVNDVIQFQNHGSLNKGKVKTVINYAIPTLSSSLVSCKMEEKQKHKGAKNNQTSIGVEKVEREKITKVIGKKKIVEAREETTSPKTLRSKTINCVHEAKFRISFTHFRRENKGYLEERYQILQVIGKGSFGEVKKIKDRCTGELRAVKVMQKKYCQMTKDFSDEIQILQKLVYLTTSNYKGSSKCCQIL